MKSTFRAVFTRKSPFMLFLLLLVVLLVVQNASVFFIVHEFYEAIISSVFLVLVAILAYNSLHSLRKHEIEVLRRLSRLKQAQKNREFDALVARLDEENRLLREYRDAIDKSSIVSKTDINGTITYVNDNFCKISGYDEVELLGKTHSIVRHSDTPKEVFRQMWDTIKAKKVWRGRIKNRKKDGGYYIVNVTISPILDAGGDIHEFIAIREDVTEYIEMGQRLEKERLARIERELAAKSAEDVSKAKDAFLIVFTHELKTPLNAIINFSNFIAKKLSTCDMEGKEKLIELAKGVRLNGESMLSTVTNILDIARLRANKISFANEGFDLAALVREVMMLSSSIAHARNINVTTELEDGIIIRSDSQRVSQVVSNIYSNALKYGKGEVFISLTGSGGMFTLVVEDNGGGISDKEGAFELFGAAQNDLARMSGGTGIGLNFAKLLCRGLGFELILEDSSRLGGAKFILSGPIERHKEAA